MATFVLLNRTRLLVKRCILGIALRHRWTSTCRTFAFALRRTCMCDTLIRTVLLTKQAMVRKVLLLCTLWILTLRPKRSPPLHTSLRARMSTKASPVDMLVRPGRVPACLSSLSPMAAPTSLNVTTVPPLPILTILFIEARFPTSMP